MSVEILAINVNKRSIRAWARLRRGPVARDMERRGERVRARAADLAPKKTGRLANSIFVEVRYDDVYPYAVVGTDVDYAWFQLKGTGERFADGGGQTIIMRPGKVMVWRDGGDTVFSRRSRGVPPVPFLTDALSAAT